MFEWDFEINISKNIFIQGTKKVNNKILTYVDFYLYSDLPDNNYICDKWNFSGRYKDPLNYMHIPKEIIYPIKYWFDSLLI